MKINLGSNIRYLREKKGLDQQQLSEILDVPRSTLACWENNIRTPKLEQIIKIAEYFKTNLDIIYANFDNASPIDINPNDNYIKIPVLGVIKAGIPIEAQQDILEYIDVPKSWTKGGKELFGLRISGDSMFPKYNEGDTVVFEKNNDFETANNKDVAIMINGDDATFKKLLINTEGITLVPYNTGAYELMMYSNKDIEEKPIRIIGIARKIIKEV
ncbi:MAG: helix-turn-helix domain-containing protein [Bacilli bacterium]|nr:helix-turn-helix domain-containing protein [Bacilli bacterium]